MKNKIPVFLSSALLSLPIMAEEKVEVLHWWTSGGEASAIKVLKDDLKSKGVTWEDMAVAGGGGESGMAVVGARVATGNPPTSVLMLGFDIHDWASDGALANLNSVAKEDNWDEVVPKAIQKFSKFEGNWVAAPVNVHSTNWVWANAEVLKKSGVPSAPKTWDEFMDAAKKVQDAGYIALAHGGQPWQEAILFDGVVLATGGADYYRKAFYDNDPSALNSETTKKIFERMSQLRSLIDKESADREWNVASEMVINGKAAFQIMGDWAKGEFLKASKVPGEDFLCFRVPGSEGSVSFNADQFAMFNVDEKQKLAQQKLARAIMKPSFQSSFNVIKGAAPARTDVSDAAFDVCGKKAMKDLAEANNNGTLVGSISLGHAVKTALKNSYYDVISLHFGGAVSDSDAVSMLSSASNE